MKNFYFLFAIIILLSFGNLFSDELVKYDISNLDNPSPGYIFTTSENGKYLAIYDNYGMPAYYKSLEKYGNIFNSLRILNNGSFACFCGAMNGWLILDNNMNVIDSVKSKYPYVTDFHTLQVSPEGNYLISGLDQMTVNMAEKVAGGKSSASVANCILQEINSRGNVVFQWSTYDHIDILDATWDINLTDNFVDPYHINSAEYDTDGNILANFRNLDELIKINRTTGEIMWVLGGCKSRKNQFAFYNDTYEGFTGFSHQHNPKRLPNGNILMFDNGNLKPSRFSRAVEYQINETGKTATKVWEYRATPDIFAAFMGNA